MLPLASCRRAALVCARCPNPSRGRAKRNMLHSAGVESFVTFMCALLFSNSTNPGCGYLDHCEPVMKAFLAGVRW